MTVPVITEDGQYLSAIDATAEAVASAIPFLTPAMIMHPAKGAIDGSPWARYVVIHLLVTVFDIPKKRLCALKVTDLQNIKQGCRVIEARLEDHPSFRAWLEPIAAAAVANFQMEAANG